MPDAGLHHEQADVHARRDDGGRDVAERLLHVRRVRDVSLGGDLYELHSVRLDREPARAPEQGKRRPRAGLRLRGLDDRAERRPRACRLECNALERRSNYQDVRVIGRRVFLPEEVVRRVRLQPNNGIVTGVYGVGEDGLRTSLGMNTLRERRDGRFAPWSAPPCLSGSRHHRPSS